MYSPLCAFVDDVRVPVHEQGWRAFVDEFAQALYLGEWLWRAKARFNDVRVVGGCEDAVEEVCFAAAAVDVKSVSFKLTFDVAREGRVFKRDERAWC